LGKQNDCIIQAIKAMAGLEEKAEELVSQMVTYYL